METSHLLPGKIRKIRQTFSRRTFWWSPRVICTRWPSRRSQELTSWPGDPGVKYGQMLSRNHVVPTTKTIPQSVPYTGGNYTHTHIYIYIIPKMGGLLLFQLPIFMLFSLFLMNPFRDGNGLAAKVTVRVSEGCPSTSHLPHRL